MSETRNRCVELACDEELLFLDPAEQFDPAILGIAGRIGLESVVAYDRDKVIQRLIEIDEMSHEDALEHFSYNIEGSYVGEKTPIFVTLLTTAT